jgi:L-lactate dehydrogenase (cytochrome)
MPLVSNIADLRALAYLKIPRVIFDFVDGGAYDEVTMNANRAELDALRFHQRVMVDVSTRSLQSTILGDSVLMPIVIAPAGLTGLVHRDGEILAARAAQACGVPFCLSTMSICSIEDVHAAVDKPFWFQLYVMKDREFSKSLIQRAITAKCSALVLAVDAPMRSQLNRDIKNGLAVPPRLTLGNALNLATKPTWILGVLLGRRRKFGNLSGHFEGATDVKSYSSWIINQFDPSLTWQDVRWVRDLWPGKLIVKGVLSPKDARLAADCGCDAIVVSNHGGRQLDGAPSSISVLSSVVDAVGQRVEVLFDSGVRCGQDVLKALALGARACMVGRAPLYGLGAMGEAGVRTALEILRKELDFSMALTGLHDVREASKDLLWPVDAGGLSWQRSSSLAESFGPPRAN